MLVFQGVPGTLGSRYMAQSSKQVSTGLCFFKLILGTCAESTFVLMERKTFFPDGWEAFFPAGFPIGVLKLLQ